MRRYQGLAVAMTGADVSLTANTAIVGFDVILSCTQPFTVKGQNGAIMATVAANTPLYLNGNNKLGAEGQIRLSEYSANAASGTLYVGYSVRATS